MADNEKDYYAILGVSTDAGQDEIRAVYRRLAFALHPDRNSDPESQIRFQEVIEAYTVLSDPEQRAQYDVRLFDEKPVIVTKRLAKNEGFDVNAAYDEIAEGLPNDYVHSQRAQYLKHLERAKRRRRVLEVIFTIVVILLLAFFGFQPLKASSGSVSTATQSTVPSASGGPTTTIINKTGVDQQLLVVQGAQGPQGLVGPAGPAGVRGLDGRIGVDGHMGVDGATGPAGPAGPTGAAGPAGPAGATGPAGPAGAAGAAGPAGTNGTNGRDATVYTVRPNLGVGSGIVAACTDAIDTPTYGTNPVSLDISLNVAYNPTTFGYTLSKINIANIPKPCVGDYMQINVQLSDPLPTPHTANAQPGAHFNCVMTSPLSLAANFHNGVDTYGKYSFLAGGSECTTDSYVNSTHSGFVDGSNNPTDGAALDIGTVYATDLAQISIVVSS
jgi:hypothetical protein